MHLFTLLALLLGLLLLVAGCQGGEPAGEKPAADGGGLAPNSAEDDGSAEESETDSGSKSPLAVGEKGSGESFTEIAVTKVEATDSLSSPAAKAALQTGGAGESPEPDTKAAGGNELLLITVGYKPKKAVNIAPAYIKLAGKDGKEYSEVTTNGYGGVFNNQPVEPGQDGQVTAVYEVPAGAKDLVFTVEPFGETPIEFSVR